MMNAARSMCGVDLVEPGSFADGSDPAVGGAGIESAAVVTHQDRSFGAFADGEVERSRGSGDEGYAGWLVAFADDLQGSISAFEAEGSRHVDIVPDGRVVQAVAFVSDDPAFAGTMTMTWEVTAVAGRTRVDITADDVPVGICAEDHAEGLASSLANLADHVER